MTNPKPNMESKKVRKFDQDKFILGLVWGMLVGLALAIVIFSQVLKVNYKRAERCERLNGYFIYHPDKKGFSCDKWGSYACPIEDL